MLANVHSIRMIARRPTFQIDSVVERLGIARGFPCFRLVQLACAGVYLHS